MFISAFLAFEFISIMSLTRPYELSVAGRDRNRITACVYVAHWDLKFSSCTSGILLYRRHADGQVEAAWWVMLFRRDKISALRIDMKKARETYDRMKRRWEIPQSPKSYLKEIVCTSRRRQQRKKWIWMRSLKNYLKSSGEGRVKIFTRSSSLPESSFLHFSSSGAQAIATQHTHLLYYSQCTHLCRTDGSSLLCSHIVIREAPRDPWNGRITLRTYMHFDVPYITFVCDTNYVCPDICESCSWFRCSLISAKKEEET